MLNNFTESISLSATSIINGDVVSYMNANISNPGGFNINNSIQDMPKYLENQDTVDADYEEFRVKVLEILKQYKKEGE